MALAGLLKRLGGAEAFLVRYGVFFWLEMGDLGGGFDKKRGGGGGKNTLEHAASAHVNANTTFSVAAYMPLESAVTDFTVFMAFA